ncbi:Asp-tRNA(Asn)/Glu-tRNA(Gln) amidotransferase subunit GatB [Candidatus Persebacteraceae bacterium Df01]|jgi:aspartyl-tRNA(Asn)/glutamyl-tRNA(Gln) amidotransferase subunit B|uniref:Aspartyl/glutamyl-tRNA(Asn/Gln) amidotransferase subunit B n=1 Tax=Candidatus Doriopsillibacter californiensis TaxID=2970740 RepID=A0ABT7QLJ2_9GAMM|nr:Asp-tRNA(Asn)/Glu-tRNA(Gln) amidotransferase subunit GatB [Candidatus Persebacteraceae bacterium Df01]
MKWECVIGLEIHAQLKTASKIFSPAAATYCDTPNQHVREVDCGLPGALPVLNRTVVEYAIRLGLALESEISELSEFARKNYFYPDLPKGYQISQFDYPIVSGGRLAIDMPDGEKIIGITRAHLEEDAGKLLHDVADGASGVDLNRAGVPLLEIVSEPDMRSIAEATAYAKAMHRLVRWLGVCDGNMQEGSFRVDANISVRRPNAQFGTRCEIKNLNSFRFLEQALEYEMMRQINVLEGGGTIEQQTRLFDSVKGVTRAMRSKENAHDYRYFPDPDLPPLAVSKAWIERVRQNMPELPATRRTRFMEVLGLSAYDAGVLTAERELADYFEAVLAAFSENNEPTAAKTCANWVCGELSGLMNKSGVSVAALPVSAVNLANLLQRIVAGDVSGKTAKTVLEKMWAHGEDADVVITREGLAQISDADALEKIADEIIAANPTQTEQYRAGKEKLFGFFVGQMMKATKGQANPAQTNEILRRKLT